jgi:SAM-dependent methyltransferase
MARINLMARYPKTNRNSFIDRSAILSEEQISLAREFGKEYFDGSREMGLGGYYYDPRFFRPVVEDFIRYYNLNNDSSILDVGCGKGFMIHDFIDKLPNARFAGLDISKYCLDNSISTATPYLIEGSCDKLPWNDNSFDLVISIATIHNLDLNGVKKSLEEIVRVTRRNAFIKVNGYKNEKDLEKLKGWNLVAKTILHEREWLKIFEETGYVYDYDFFVP